MVFWYVLEYGLLLVYGGIAAFLFVFSLLELHLVWIYWRSKRQASRGAPALEGPPETWPLITVQLPVYNELYIIDQVIEAVARFDWPRDRLEIQVLDDSTDETRELIDQAVARWQAEGVRMQVLRRPDRTGYKAGALEYGLARASGELIAVFDADFVPPADFLKRVVPHFQDRMLGAVQTRWGHLNRNWSWLTRMQAFGLDAHFTVEQNGRSRGGFFMNFNGTAGIWRKSCIESSGGWQYDTLTEDLDLSYRAQLAGWRLRYLDEVVSPAELPIEMFAVKSQQYRWTKGGAETARKLLPRVLRAPLPLLTRLHAFFHLVNSSVFVVMLLLAVCSVPLLWFKARAPETRIWFDLYSVFTVSFFFFAAVYYISYLQYHLGRTASWLKFTLLYALFLAVMMGLSLHNARAALSGWLGRKSPFIRTPKFNVRKQGKTWRRNKYLLGRLGILTLLEGLLAAYAAFGVWLGVWLGEYSMLLFHLMLVFGYGYVFGMSVWHAWIRQR